MAKEMERAMRFAGKTAVITGAASGIGKATCLLFAREGATVIAADIDAAGGEALAGSSGGKILFCETDVCDVAAIERLMTFAADQTGGIDMVFNNAGAGGAREKIDEIDAAGWDRTMDLLLRSVAMGIRYAVPHMTGREGAAIINTASIAGLRAGYSPTAYAVAKAAVIQLTRVGAMDLAKHKIRMNAICPGFIKTNIFATALDVPPEKLQMANAMIGEIAAHAQPVHGGGDPDDIANMVAFLASKDAKFITGAHFVVDGGITVGERQSWDDSSPGMFEALDAFLEAANA
jgi:NAD(P)-dependent dehydrogenase (short-subunit alcohol dehydrogenase family)